MIRLMSLSCDCHEYLHVLDLEVCFTAKMAITIGFVILFSFIKLSSGHGQDPPRPQPSESSTAYVCKNPTN